MRHWNTVAQSLEVLTGPVPESLGQFARNGFPCDYWERIAEWAVSLLGAAPDMFAGCCRHLGRAFCFTNRRMWTGTYPFALDRLPARCPGNSAWENALSVSTFTEATPLQPQGEVGTPAVFVYRFLLGRENKPAQRNPPGTLPSTASRLPLLKAVNPAGCLVAADRLFIRLDSHASRGDGCGAPRLVFADRASDSSISPQKRHRLLWRGSRPLGPVLTALCTGCRFCAAYGRGTGRTRPCK